MAHENARPKVRDDDARGTPAGAGTITPEHGGRIGNPPFVPTEQQRRDVEAWTRAGLTADGCAELLGISRATVDRHFKAELRISRLKVQAAIGASLVRKALAGNLTAQIFYLRTQAKWNVRIEHTGADGGAIKTFDLSALAIEEKRVLLNVIDQLLSQQEGGEADGDTADGHQPTVN